MKQYEKKENDDHRDREAAAYESLTAAGGHPNVIAYYGSRGVNLIALELVPLGSLQKCNAAQQPRVDARALGGIARALAHCHNKLRIVHCDVTDSNILVCGDPLSYADGGGVLKLCDFGAARFLDKMHAGDDADNPEWVTAVHFRAPELLALQPAWCEKVDTWSFGAVAYRQKTGKLLVQSFDPLEILKGLTEIYGAPYDFNRVFPFGRPFYWNAKGRYVGGRQLSQLLDTFPADRVIDAALAFYPKDRPSMSEISALYEQP